ncbi:hypothetical protein BCV69DRAFT_282785 [Microstroma glucosiphilum]|uniref:GATOR1 complex protein NPRL3 C-terminal HTH domain-containing protein n=1 Tax=Pseudomicrostroma glucosiphilum TaxID=1684307 RepID=A0A316U5R1_9BASI|nr:hypothetical protein BCV69DRAFT_282785 [Pseudomicrostroma glucosiphilum]PWN20576.1 hypothetical protein BCV69DRAFT_282785 [Pseudomicrostroma glucosiphilum]
MAGNTSDLNTSSLVAVLLVTSTSSRAPQVVFRYPRKPRPLRRLSKVQYYAGQQAEWAGEASQSAYGRGSTATDGFSIGADEQHNWAQWEEQGEDSEASSLSDQGTSSDDGSFGSSDHESASGSDSDQRSITEASELTDNESASEALSTSRTGPAASVGRRSRRDIDPSSSLRYSSRNPASSSRVSSQRRARSPSVARMSSSLRDPTVEYSPERHSQAGESAGRARRRGLTLTATDQQQLRDPRKSIKEHSPSRRARNAKAFSTYLGFPVEDLAEFLAPDRDLCNRRFDFTVDDLTFVGHPVRIPSKSRNTQNTDSPDDQDERGRQGRSAQQSSDLGAASAPPSASTGSSATPEVTLFHLILVLQSPDPSYAAPSLDLTTWLGFWYDNVCFKMTAALWAEEQRCSYVSEEADVLFKLWGEVEGNSGSGPSYALHLNRILLTSSMARCFRNLYRCLSRPSPHRTPFVTVNELDVHLQLPPLLVDPARMVKSIMELGPSIDAVNAEMRAEQEGGRGAGELVRGTGAALDEWTKASGPPLFPWKTLLLLSDPEDEDVPKIKRYRSLGGQVVELSTDDESSLDELEEVGLADAGIEIWAKRFTALLKPTVSGLLTFNELAALLGWDLEEDVYPMARHLVYYKQARVIDVPMIQNTYGLSPLVDLASISRFSTSFALRFPQQQPLPRLLAALGSSFQPFYNHWLSVHSGSSNAASSSQEPQKDPTRRQNAFDVLIWLLRHEIIIQQHLRFRLIASEAVKRKARQMWEEQRALRDEALHRREELKEWRRERRALKKGPDPSRREGELVPLVPQSAPGGSGFQTTSVGAPIEEGDRGRAPRPRSRSAEARDRSRGTSKDDPLASKNAASRVSSSSSRSRSRNPLPLGRISALGRLTSAAGGSGVYTPEGSYRRGQGGTETALEFERRPVQRSRSPSSNLPTGLEVVTHAKDNSSGSGAVLQPVNSFTRDRAASFLAEQHRRRALSMVRGGTANSVGSGEASHHSSPRTESHQFAASGGGVGIGRGRPRGESSASGSALPAHMAAQRRLSRSPSRARMRVRGFGDQEEVWIDGEEVKVEDEEEVGLVPAAEEARRLSNVGEEESEVQAAAAAAQASPSLGTDPDTPQVRETAGLHNSVHESVRSKHATFDLHPGLSDRGGRRGTSFSSDGSADDDDDSDGDSDLSQNPYLNQNFEEEFPEPSYDFTPSLISVPNRASREESAWIHAMLEGKDDVSDAFRRLTPYLDGRHTIDEALADGELNMRRRDLRNLLNRFAEEILTFVHP